LKIKALKNFWIDKNIHSEKLISLGRKEVDLHEKNINFIFIDDSNNFNRYNIGFACQ